MTSRSWTCEIVLCSGLWQQGCHSRLLWVKDGEWRWRVKVAGVIVACLVFTMMNKGVIHQGCHCVEGLWH